MRNREESARKALRNVTAEFLARLAGPQSLITVTRAEISSDFSRAKIYLSVLPEEKAPGALGVANRSVQELKEFLRSRVKLPRIPYIEFMLERGENSLKNSDALPHS